MRGLRRLIFSRQTEECAVLTGAEGRGQVLCVSHMRNRLYEDTGGGKERGRAALSVGGR